VGDGGDVDGGGHGSGHGSGERLHSGTRASALG